MKGGLAKAEQRFEDVHLGLGQAVAVDALEERGAVIFAEFVVEFALRSVEFAIEGLFEARWEVAGDLFLGSAEDEGAQRLGENQAGVGVGIAERGLGVDEDRGGAEHSGVEEIEERPEIAEVVLDGGSGEGEAMVAFDEADGFGGFGGGVFDGLGFVEDDVIELDILEELDIPAEGAVGGDDDVVIHEGLAMAGAFDAGVVEEAEFWSKTVGFGDPVEDERFGDDDEGGGNCRLPVVGWQ